MSESKKRKSNDINVKNVDNEVFEYQAFKQIPMTVIVKNALSEYMQRDKEWKK